MSGRAHAVPFRSDDHDLSAHVVACERACGRDDAGLTDEVARLFEQRLDRERPLWRIDVIDPMADGHSALVWRLNHALVDGSTAMRIANAVLWDEDSDPERSPFEGMIGAERSVAVVTVGLDDLRRVARAHDGATVNDAVLTVVAGGLRRWLEAHNGHLGAVRVKVPVSLHNQAPANGSPADSPGNRDSFFCLDLPLGSADPLERLGAIRRAMRVRKEGHDAQQLDAMMRRLARVPRLAQFADRVLTHPRSFALAVSNVPGPSRPVAVLGERVQALFTRAEIREQHALRVAVVSLADTLNFGLVADPTLLPDVDQLARGIVAEAAALVDHLRLV